MNVQRSQMQFLRSRLATTHSSVTDNDSMQGARGIALNPQAKEFLPCALAPGLTVDVEAPEPKPPVAFRGLTLRNSCHVQRCTISSHELMQVYFRLGSS